MSEDTKEMKEPKVKPTYIASYRLSNNDPDALFLMEHITASNISGALSKAVNIQKNLEKKYELTFKLVSVERKFN